MRDNKSLLLILLSVSLIATWVYHLYDKSQYAGRTREVYIKDSVAVAEAVSDSLKRIFNRTLDRLGKEKMNIDSANTNLKGELGVRIMEINRMRDEIGVILKRKNLTQADLNEAKEKIKELQNKIDGMQGENSSLAEEKTRLSGLLSQLNTEMAALQENMSKVSSENREMAKTLSDASVFIASEIKLAAVNVRPEQKEAETSQAKRADKFVASFALQNNVAAYPNAEVVVIITDPEGKALRTEIWDSGSFETKSEGRKSFTRKMKFEYQKSEVKRLIFSIEPESFQKGVYKISIYHQGIRIGESGCKLS